MTTPSSKVPTYTLYKMDISYFSGKLECYLRSKGIPYEPVEVGARAFARIHAATGVKKVPAIELADGRWLFDTTPTIEWLETQQPTPCFRPPDPALAFVATLIEDYADEWLWRPAMWWRWEPMPSRLALGRRIAESVALPGVPKAAFAHFFAWRQRRIWLWGDGVDRGNATAVRNLYLEELDLLEAVLQRQPFLLGDTPSVADFGYCGPMFRHFGNDPDPAEFMRRRAPNVAEWLARLWNGPQAARTPRWRWPDAPEWQALWARIAGDYLPYLHANALAFRDGRRRFDWQGASMGFRRTITHYYRVACRRQLQQAYDELDAAARERVDALFAPHGGLAALHADGAVDPGGAAMPVLPVRAGAHRQPWRIAVFGQPRN